MVLPYSSPVRSETRQAVIKVWTDESRSWNDVRTDEVTDEDYQHVTFRSIFLEASFSLCVYYV